MNDNPDNLFTAARPAVTPYQGRLSVIPIFRAFRVLISAILIFSCAAPARAATRVVLVSTGARATGKNLLTLAEAKVSALADIQLLERRQLDLVLQEQHLALEEWVDSKSAVKIGQLLRADLIASIESASDSGKTFSLVVFDAESGARLWDAMLPADLDSAVTAAAQGIQAAIRKLQLPVSARHVVSVFTVRNADLPRSLDQFCAAVGRLLERNLTGSSNLILLERSRLVALNQERELPAAMAATNSLLAAVGQLQVDVSRASDGVGLQAVGVLSSPTRSLARRVSVKVAGENAVELADALAGAIRQELVAEALPVPEKSQRQIEAQQFFQEAKVRQTHAETEAAWRASEAAHALAPDNLSMENQLMCYLLDEGCQRPLTEALDFGIRSLSFRELRLRHALNTADRNRMWEEEARENEGMAALARFTRQIAKPARASSDPVVREKYERFAKQLLVLDWDRFEAWARLTTRNPQDFVRFNAIMTSPNAIAVCNVLTESEFVTRLDRSLRRWLEVANALPPASVSASAVQGLMRQIGLVFNWGGQLFLGINFHFQPEHFKNLKPVAEEIAASPNQVISAEGRNFLSYLESSVTNGLAVNGGWTTGPIKNFIIDDNFTNLLADCRAKIKTGVAISPVDLLGSYTAAIDCMLTNKFIDSPTVEEALKLAERQRLSNAKWLSQINEVLAAVDDAQFVFSRAGIARESWKGTLLAFQKKAAATAAQETNSTPPPWGNPIQLLDVKQFPQLDAFVWVGIAGDTVYGLGVKDKFGNRSVVSLDNRIEFFLVRAPLGGGTAQIVNHANFTTAHDQNRQPIPHIELVGSNLLLLVAEAPSRGKSFGVYAMPVDGKPVVRLDEQWDLPNHEIGAFTVVNNQIFLGLSGYLVKCDLDSKKTEVLASSRRAEQRSELDNGELFQTLFLHPDAKRDRIIVTLVRGSETQTVVYDHGSSTRTANAHCRTEFWALDLADGRLKLLASRAGGFAPGSIGNQSGADQLLFSGPFHLEALHLDAAKLETLSTGLPMEDQEWKLGPQFIQQGYLWSGGAFGRVALAGKKKERFPWVSPPDPEATPSNRYPFFHNIPYCFAPVADSRNVLLGTAAGAWLLPLRSIETKIDANLTKETR